MGGLNPSHVVRGGRWGGILPCLTGAMLVCAALVGACTTESAAPPRKVRVRLATGTPGAGFYALGQSLVPVFAKLLPDVVLEISESAGSVSNVQGIRQGVADLTFAYSDVAYMAFAGRLSDDEGPLEVLRAIAVLRPTPLHLVVSADSQIRGVADLRRRRVGMGVRGSGTALTASLVLQAFHMKSSDVLAESLRYNDGARRLTSGTLDAMFVGASYPAEAVRIASAAGARLIPLTGREIDRLLQEYPFLRMTVIPAGTYSHQAAPISTLGPDSLLVCRADVDEGLIYRITRAFFDALPAIAAENEWLRLMDVEQAPAAPIPLHEGAIRYYRERELAR